MTYVIAQPWVDVSAGLGSPGGAGRIGVACVDRAPVLALTAKDA